MPIEALAWMTEIGILKPPEPGRFGAGDARGTAASGEVRVSAAVVEAATGSRDRFDFEPLGDVSLKGFAEPVPVFRVTRS